MAGFIKLNKNEETEELLMTEPEAFRLLTIIAWRAKRTTSFSTKGLGINQALIGDYQAMGFTHRRYRTALEKLQKWGFVALKPTNKGTVVTLINSVVWDINSEDTDKQPTSNRQTTDKQPTTNKEGKKERKKEAKLAAGELDLDSMIYSLEFPDVDDMKKSLLVQEVLSAVAMNSEITTAMIQEKLDILADKIQNSGITNPVGYFKRQLSDLTAPPMTGGNVIDLAKVRTVKANPHQPIAEQAFSSVKSHRHQHGFGIKCEDKALCKTIIEQFQTMTNFKSELSRDEKQTQRKFETGYLANLERYDQLKLTQVRGENVNEFLELPTPYLENSYETTATL